MTCSLVEGCPRPETKGGGCIQHKFAGGIRVNGLALFRHDRDLGMTQMEKAKEMFSDARRDKKDIARVPGRRRPHEKKTAAGWERV